MNKTHAATAGVKVASLESVTMVAKYFVNGCLAAAFLNLNNTPPTLKPDKGLEFEQKGVSSREI
jgi:hypothetical protein